MIQPDTTKAQKAARIILRELGIHNPPINTVDIAEKLGIEVNQQEMPKGYEFVSCYMDFEDPEIVVNAKQSPQRKRFVIAHEIAHFILHQEDYEKDPKWYQVQAIDDLPEEGSSHFETEANAFAAILIAPEEVLQEVSNAPAAVQETILGMPEQALKYRKELQDE